MKQSACRLTQTVLHLLVLILMASPAAAADFDRYKLADEFNFPLVGTADESGPIVFDNLSDGRILALATRITDPAEDFLGEPQLLLETEPGSRQFTDWGDLPLPDGGRWSSSGGAFLKSSPGPAGERRIAVGNNRFDPPLVGIFMESDLFSLGPMAMPIDWYAVDHFDAAWYDDRHLALSSGGFTTSQVHLLDTDSPTNAAVRTLLLDGIAGASGGVGFDSAGNLYAANGFEDSTPGGSGTGTIRRFDVADWQAALLSGTPINYETQGTEVATVLSGGSLQFDREDNLLVGGSDFFGGGDADFFALLPGPGILGETRHFDPDTAATSFYVLSHNAIRREFYANQPFALDFPPNIDNTRVYVYLPVLAGDLDGDDDVDFDDIGPMVLGLNDPPGYEAQFGLQPHVRGDLDGDGDLDFDDLPPFVSLLGVTATCATGFPAPVPEPSSLVLALACCMGALLGLAPCCRPGHPHAEREDHSTAT